MVPLSQLHRPGLPTPPGAAQGTIIYAYPFNGGRKVFDVLTADTVIPAIQFPNQRKGLPPASALQPRSISASFGNAGNPAYRLRCHLELQQSPTAATALPISPCSSSMSPRPSSPLLLNLRPHFSIPPAPPPPAITSFHPATGLQPMSHHPMPYNTANAQYPRNRRLRNTNAIHSSPIPSSFPGKKYSSRASDANHTGIPDPRFKSNARSMNYVFTSALIGSASITPDGAGG